MCLNVIAQCLIPNLICFSKPHIIARATATATQATPQRYRHGVIVTPMPALSWMSTTPLLRDDASPANIAVAEILLAVYRQTCHTALH